MTVPFDNPDLAFSLSTKFNHAPLIPVADVADEFLGLTPNTAKRKARNNELPFPVFRLSDSQKAPWLVTFEHFVAYVERVSKDSHEDWYRLQG